MFGFPVGSLFRLRVSHYLDHATFPGPPRRTIACGFPALRSPFASCQGLWDLYLPDRLSAWASRSVSVLQTLNVKTPERQDGFSLRLDVYSSPQILQINGRLCHLVLASHLLKILQMAGSLCSTAVTPLHCSCGPIRHPLVFDRFPGLAVYTAYLASGDFAPGRGGFLQLLGMSLSPCCRFYPGRGEQPYQSVFGCSYCLRHTVGGSALGDFHFRGHNAFHFCYGPVTRKISPRRPCR